MTDNEIIKAFECCYGSEPCYKTGCPLFKDLNCDKTLHKAMADLINRQKAEIKEWKRVVETWVEQHEKDKAEIERLKTLAELGNMRANDYRVMRDRALKAEAEIGRMKNNAFCNVIIDEETMRNIVKEKAAEFELDIKSIKAEAIKEFAERLNDKAFHDMNDGEAIVCCCDIDNLVKEMVGDTE